MQKKQSKLLVKPEEKANKRAFKTILQTDVESNVKQLENEGWLANEIAMMVVESEETLEHLNKSTSATTDCEGIR